MDDAITAVLRALLPARVRAGLKRARSIVRAARRHSGDLLDERRLAEDLELAGIRPGDTVCVHSSLSSIGNVAGGAQGVIRALMGAVGERGTILMPAYGTAEAAIRASSDGTPIDLRTEPSQTGKITEVFRQTPGVLRSSHPFSSVCAWGAHAEYLTSAHDADERICHPDSPLARFWSLGGKVLGLGVSLGPISFYHVVEDTWDAFPFNPYGESVEIRYLDARGIEVTRRVAYYDRKLTPFRIDADGGLAVRRKMTEHLRSGGLLHEFPFGDAASWWFSARQVYAELQALATRGTTIYAETPARSIV